MKKINQNINDNNLKKDSQFEQMKQIKSHKSSEGHTYSSQVFLDLFRGEIFLWLFTREDLGVFLVAF